MKNGTLIGYITRAPTLITEHRGYEFEKLLVNFGKLRYTQNRMFARKMNELIIFVTRPKSTQVYLGLYKYQLNIHYIYLN